MKKQSVVALFFLVTGIIYAQTNVQDSFSVSGNTYKKQNGVWYSLHNGQIADQVENSCLIIKKSNQEYVSDSELTTYGLTRVCDLPLGFTSVRLNPNRQLFAAKILENNGFYVELDRRGSYDSNPNDFYFYPASSFWGQWGLIKIGMQSAWDLTRGNSNIIVATIDSGTEYDHEDLTGNLWVNISESFPNNVDDDYNGKVDDVHGWDFLQNDNDPRPNGVSINPHGTNVAGIIHARANNTKGVAGIAGGWGTTKGAAMMVLRVDTNVSQIFEALEYAAQMGAHVANLSISFGSSSPAMEQLFQFFSDNYGTIYVCSAGNNIGYVRYPAAYPSTIAVGAITRADLKPNNTSFGEELDLAAPSDVITTDPMGEAGTSHKDMAWGWEWVNGVYSDNYYPTFSGTSAAAPHVTGAIALMLSLYPGLSNPQIKELLHSTAQQVGPYDYHRPNAPNGHSLELGYGLLQAYNAINSANNIPTLSLINNFNLGIVLFPGAPYNYETPTETISWQRRNFTGPVNLELYDQDGFVMEIAHSVNGSSYQWHLPPTLNANAHHYHIKIVGGPGIYDYMDRRFFLIGMY